ncbi:MAG: hypothetical protein BAJALOKI1v1_2400001 [Promethearchaeota archaeon]|nr:MAG: hypothetical protein BAJALOKI1v1_2400001 [Candidatus Lokiarchaeota archaeon]
MEEIKDFIKQLTNVGEELMETLQHRAKLSTLFDIFSENLIPRFVSEKELKEYYEKRMEDVNKFIETI